MIEEVLDLIDAGQRKVLLTRVSIGEADHELLAAVSGIDDSSALAQIRLVDRSGD